MELMPHSHYPLAYHITFGTYGTRLHGGDRVTVHRPDNEFGDPLIGVDGEWERIEQSLLRFPPRELTIDQRLFIEDTVPSICQRGGWTFVDTAAAPDHVHNVLEAQVDGKDVRKWLKRWLSEALSKRWPLQPEQVWWAECGSVKWVWFDDYYGRVKKYVRDQRAHRDPEG
jgi:REP element-mobilizing transposase RayT